MGETRTLYTQMNVSENEFPCMDLLTKDAQAMFRILTGVSGVGPKVGLAILSVMGSGQDRSGDFRRRPKALQRPILA